MCNICGCHHEHENNDHSHEHFSHDLSVSETKIIQIEQSIMSKNNEYALQNKQIFKEKNVFCLNLLSSPGAGKTTFLIKTIQKLKEYKIPMFVIEGDQETSRDAELIKKENIPAKQINTGKGCHLDAHMIAHALEEFDIVDNSILFIENIGNLVCPAEFNLGEHVKVVLLSVTEGEDKPIKYPTIFANAQLVIISKMDIAEAVGFNLTECVNFIKQVNPFVDIITLSSRTEFDFSKWLNWLFENKKYG